MKRFLIGIAIFFPFCLLGSEISLNLGSGYRQDILNWNISGGKNGPNVLSELKWKDLKIWETYGELKISIPFCIYLRSYADYGKICAGKNQDIDYLSNNRRNIFSLSHSKANKGEVFDFSCGLGWQHSFFCGKIKIAPLLGFSKHVQHLRIIHGSLVIDSLDPSNQGPLPNLHSNYRTQWRGPWAGIDFSITPFQKWELFGSYEYHWSFFKASGHWNLRHDFFKNFKHSGHGQGSLFKMGLNYSLFCWCHLGILFKYQTMRITHGTDTIFFMNDGIRDKAKTCVNQVNWHSFSVLSFVGCKF